MDLKTKDEIMQNRGGLKAVSMILKNGQQLNLTGTIVEDNEDTLVLVSDRSDIMTFYKREIAVCMEFTAQTVEEDEKAAQEAREAKAKLQEVKH